MQKHVSLVILIQALFQSELDFHARYKKSAFVQKYTQVAIRYERRIHGTFFDLLSVLDQTQKLLDNKKPQNEYF